MNVACTDHDGLDANADFYLAMVRALRVREQDVVALAPDPEQLLLCCSSASDEVGYCWAISAVAGEARAPVR